jgi:hypothetical protein
VANMGPVQCDECGKWFEVTTQTVYHSEERLDYAAGKAAALNVDIWTFFGRVRAGA